MNRFLCLSVLSAAFLGCDNGSQRDPDANTPGETEVLKASDPFNPQGRHFLQKNVPVMVTDLNEEFIQEFIAQPRNGGARMVILPVNANLIWTELVPDSDSDRPFVRYGQMRLGEKTPDVAPPEYDAINATMRLPGGKVVAVREQIWKVTDRRLMNVSGEGSPVVYMIEPGSNHDRVKGAKEITGKTAPKRPLDRFETEALDKLREGNDVMMRTSDQEIRVLGAIRARGECLSCHKVEVGTMLGAFTYTLHRADQATPDVDRLKDITGLTPTEKSAIAQIEATGGKVIRESGKPVSELHLTHMVNMDIKTITNFGQGLAHTQLRNSGLNVLEVFPDLQKLDVSYSLITNEGFKEIIKLKKLKELNIQGTQLSQADVKELQKSMPDCKILHVSTVMPAP